MGAAILRDVRPRAAVLLRTAMGDLALDRGRAACSVWQTGALAFPNAGELVYKSAPGKRLSAVGGLSLMDWRRAASLSIMQVVRRSESATQGLVAFVSLSLAGRNRFSLNLHTHLL